MSTPRFGRSIAARTACVVAWVCLVGMDGIAIADEDPTWDLQIGAGVAYMPDYSGARASGSQLRAWADGAYRTGNLGTFGIDSGSLTIDPDIRWAPLDKPELGFGVLIGYRAGRDDSKPGFTSANSGSTRLAGLPNVRGSFDAGVEGHVAVLGVPLFAQIRSATRVASKARL